MNRTILADEILRTGIAQLGIDVIQFAEGLDTGKLADATSNLDTEVEKQVGHGYQADECSVFW